MLGRYQIVRPIDRGGMATVYLARQLDLDRLVALKELSLPLDLDPKVARRFLREARLAGSLTHPNIVTVHDYFEHDGTPYIAMEYLSRGSLRAHIGRLSAAQIGGVLDGVLAALIAAEHHGVVHRDLKPENVLITDEGSVKIADFGIAKATDAVTGALTTTGTVLGTPNYMAPEQATDEQLGPWTDLYSLGVMAFELHVGKVPFHDTDTPVAVLMRHVNEQIPPVISLVPDVDPALSEWIDRLVERNPIKRLQSASQAREQLEEVLLASVGPRWRRESALPELVRSEGETYEISGPREPTVHEDQNTVAPSTFLLGAEAAAEAPTAALGEPRRWHIDARLILVTGLVIAALLAAFAIAGKQSGGAAGSGAGSGGGGAQTQPPAAQPVGSGSQAGPSAPAPVAAGAPAQGQAAEDAEPTSPCAGDSMSDDPSDDSCGGEP